MRTLTVDERYCEELTRHAAGNFYWGFVALPRHQRTAIYALYSLARQIDDDVDRAGDDGALARLSTHRARLAACVGGRPEDPVTRVLAEVIERHEIPARELEALIDGVEMDVRIRRYATWDELRVYCRHVASSVGRMCVRIFGFRDPAALEYADDLGIAMQIANILRDVREDAQIGRVYLPQTDLAAFGVDEGCLAAGQASGRWSDLVQFELERAAAHFTSGLRVTDLIPRRAAVCVLTMAGLYQTIALEIRRDPFLPLDRRVSLSRHQKLSVLLRSWLQVV
ncbi:MAG TPA: presqualene diphosphate synthase HpnD [Chloroflexota bacterium]|nr:presqualene diphosphate synthase HpnD [Chloroflexota bacterium]